MTGGVELADHYGSFQPKPIYDSVILWFYDSIIKVIWCLSCQTKLLSSRSFLRGLKTRIAFQSGGNRKVMMTTVVTLREKTGWFSISRNLKSEFKHFWEFLPTWKQQLQHALHFNSFWCTELLKLPLESLWWCRIQKPSNLLFIYV